MIDPRYHTRRWRNLYRKPQLRREPWCRFCTENGYEGVLATVADHIVPVRGGSDEMFWTHELQSLCARCHSSIKHFIELNGYSPTIGADGLPVDPNHPTWVADRAWIERQSRKGKDHV